MKNEYITEGQEYSSCRELLQPRDNSPASAGEFYAPAQEYPEAPQEHFSSQKPTRTEKTAKRRKNRHNSVAQQAVAITAGAVAVVVLATAVVGQPIYSQPLTPEQIEASIAESMSGSDSFWNSDQSNSTQGDETWGDEGLDDHTVTVADLRLDTFSDVMAVWNQYPEYRHIDSDGEEHLYLHGPNSEYGSISYNSSDSLWSWSVFISYDPSSIKEYNYNADGVLHFLLEDFYDENWDRTGYSVLTYHYHPDGSLDFYTESFYSDDENKEILHFYHADGSLNFYTEIFYHETGYALCEKSYDADGTLSWYREFDEDGNTVHEETYDTEGSVEANPENEDLSGQHVKVSDLQLDTFSDVIAVWNQYPEYRDVRSQGEELLLYGPTTGGQIDHYLEDGSWTVFVYSYRDISTSAWSTYTWYSADGEWQRELLEIEYYNENGYLTYSEEFEYNSDGSFHDKLTTYYDGSGHGHITRTEQLIYDEDGNITDMYTRIYDENGNSTLYDKNGDPIRTD